DALHGLLDRVGVHVLDLGLGDLADVVLADLADLVLVGLARALLDARGLEQQHRGRRALGHERERAIGVDRDDHRDHQTLVLLGLRVELLAELHDVDAAGAEGGTHGRRRVGLTGLDLQLDLPSNLLHRIACSSSGAMRRRRGQPPGAGSTSLKSTSTRVGRPKIETDSLILRLAVLTSSTSPVELAKAPLRTRTCWPTS